MDYQMVFLEVDDEGEPSIYAHLNTKAESIAAIKGHYLFDGQFVHGVHVDESTAVREAYAGRHVLDAILSLDNLSHRDDGVDYNVSLLLRDLLSTAFEAGMNYQKRKTAKVLLPR
jgi:poly-beta-hydroxyalkanoate depolymerase